MGKNKDSVTKSNRVWWKIIIGCGVAIIGLIIGYVGNSVSNPFVIVIGFAGIAGGGYLAFTGWKTGGEAVFNEGRLQTVAPPNCVNIYPDKVLFEYVDKELIRSTFPRKYLQDGRYYYIHVVQKDGDYDELKLPDTEHGDNPREIGEVLQAEVVRQYLAYMPTSMAKTIAVGIMGLIIAIEVIGIIAAGG